MPSRSFTTIGRDTLLATIYIFIIRTRRRLRSQQQAREIANAEDGMGMWTSDFSFKVVMAYLGVLQSRRRIVTSTLTYRTLGMKLETIEEEEGEDY